MFPLIWISLAGHHCKSQRWAAAKLMLINEIVVIQESWECIRCFWASHDHGECQVSWPPLCLQAWRRRALQPPSSILRLAVKKAGRSFIQPKVSKLESTFLVASMASGWAAPPYSHLGSASGFLTRLCDVHCVVWSKKTFLLSTTVQLCD